MPGTVSRIFSNWSPGINKPSWPNQLICLALINASFSYSLALIVVHHTGYRGQGIKAS